MGRPTVVGDNHANREVMVHRQHAYLCPMADPTALAGAILELRSSPQLCRSLGAGGYALYRSRFTTEAIGRELESILTRLLP
jgi:glycosyltransferase involved in cell wall biosynthesis